MAFVYGALARSGKVKHQTPNVPKTRDTSYQGGCPKYKQKSSVNLEFSGGAHRFEKPFTAELKSHDDSYRKNNQRCDWVAERMNIKRSEPVLLNSFHKFNTEKGFNKVEWNGIHHEEIILKEKTISLDYRYRNGRNHKKWHRNHPIDGFYQKRVVDLDGLECCSVDDEVVQHEIIQFSHLFE